MDTLDNLPEGHIPDKFPYLARQIQGPISEAFGKGFDDVYEVDLAFLDFLKAFSIDTLSGEWLDRLGMVVGFPRPYVTKPELDQAFLFDTTLFELDGKEHGFSTSHDMTISGVPVTTDDGGVLDDLYRNTHIEPMADSVYRRSLKAVCEVKKKHSLEGIGKVVEALTDSNLYILDWLPPDPNTNYCNDIKIVLPANLMDYKEALQRAFDSMFTTSPSVIVDVNAYFLQVYIYPTVKQIVLDTATGITLSDFTVGHHFDGKIAVIDVALDSAFGSFRDDVLEALEEEFQDDTIDFNVTVNP